MLRRIFKRSLLVCSLALLMAFSTGLPAAASYPARQLYVHCGGAYYQVSVSGPNQYGASTTWFGQNNGSGVAATTGWWWASYDGVYGYVNISVKPPGGSWNNLQTRVFALQPDNWSNVWC